MSSASNQSDSIILACPKCGKKNRVPAAVPESGKYTCGACQETILAASEGAIELQKSQQESVLSQTRTSFEKLPKSLIWAYGVWLFLLAGISLLNATGPEVWWPTSANLYMPQWIWALPAIILVPWTLKVAPKWSAIPAILILYVFGPMMGFVWHPIAPTVPPGGIKLRVMQCNVKWAGRDKVGLGIEVAREHPDIIQFQDSGGNIDWLGPISQDLVGWNIRSSGQYITASRLPMSDPESIDISYPGNDNHHCTRILLTVGATTVALYNVHLLSPRWGLMSVRAHNTNGMDVNVDARIFESDKLAQALRSDQFPILLTGDLNAPMQATVYREIAGDQLSDAFQNAGNGYGYSYGQYVLERYFGKLHLPNMGVPYVRIDHILYTSQWKALRCWTGPDTLSDHVPVYADMYLTNSAPTPH